MIVTGTSAYGDCGKRAAYVEQRQDYRAAVAVFGATLSCLWRLDRRE